MLPWRLLILAGALIIALLVALAEMGKWDLILRFIYQVPYGQNEPLFDKDIGFYLFSLPVYVALKNWLLMLVVSLVLLLAVDVSWYFYLASLIAVLIGVLLLVL